MKTYLKLFILLALMLTLTGASSVEAKVTPQKKEVKVIKKKKVTVVKKKGTSRLLPAPLIDPNNPPGGL